MQSLTGSLSFCAKAMPSAREFIRRMYASMSGSIKPFHQFRLSNGIKDLLMWHQFLSECNGISYMQDKAWVSADSLRLQTYSAGGSAYAVEFTLTDIGGIYPAMTSGQNLIF